MRCCLCPGTRTDCGPAPLEHTTVLLSRSALSKSWLSSTSTSTSTLFSVAFIVVLPSSGCGHVTDSVPLISRRSNCPARSITDNVSCTDVLGGGRTGRVLASTLSGIRNGFDKGVDIDEVVEDEGIEEVGVKEEG